MSVREVGPTRRPSAAGGNVTPLRSTPLPLRWPEDRLAAWALAGGRDPESGLLQPNERDLYIPGHSVHYIQVLRSNADRERRPVQVRVVGIRGNLITVETDDRLEQVRNHEAERLAEILGGTMGSVRLQKHWSLSRAGAGRCFCIAPGHLAWRTCLCDSVPEGPHTADQLAALMVERGGFLVPSSDLINNE